MRCLDLERIRGVNGHGSTMFHRVNCPHVGGYRWQFRYAQDLVLWLRLTDLGQSAGVPAPVLRYPQLRPIVKDSP